MRPFRWGIQVRWESGWAVHLLQENTYLKRRQMERNPFVEHKGNVVSTDLPIRDLILVKANKDPPSHRGYIGAHH